MLESISRRGFLGLAPAVPLAFPFPASSTAQAAAPARGDPDRAVFDGEGARLAA